MTRYRYACWFILLTCIFSTQVQAHLIWEQAGGLASIAWRQDSGNWLQEAPPEAPLLSPLTPDPALRGADDGGEAQDDSAPGLQAEPQEEPAE